ncbi:MAG: DUF418 domain-containing protein [Acidobacteria bacterium]|nr:DUF418 domain-containing protein [Acidobacteriota bacterium]
MEPLQPTAPHERIEVLDVLRGFALLGVFAVNMLFFAQPMESHFLRPLGQHPSPWTLSALLWLAQGKFYGLFSFLFGLGFAVQMERFRVRGEQAPRRIRRRFLVLAGLGLAHGALIWPGDILFMYAVIGFILLGFGSRSDRVIRIWIMALLGGLTVLMVGVGMLMLLWAKFHPQEAAKAAAEQLGHLEASIRTSLQIYGQGPFPAILRQRLRDLMGNYGLTLAVSPQILALFLLGLLTARLGLLRESPERDRVVRRVARWGLGLGLPLNLAYVFLVTRGPGGPANPWAVVGMGAFIPGSALLCLGYAAFLALAHRRPGGAWLRALAWPGRMALSCYLAHSVVFTLIFNAYGLGLFGKVGLGPALLMALILWLAMIPLCQAWLSTFRMGPAEWLWRSLTYGRAQAFRL